MTISDEQKLKILTFYQKGVSKKDIARIEGVSYPTIRNIISNNEIEEIQDKNEERSEIVEKTLSEIFKYEDYTEGSVLELIYNLKRIGKMSNRDLGAFIEDIEVIFDRYYKLTNNTIKLFDFFMDISNNMSFITDSFDIEKLLELIEDFIDQQIFLEELRKEYNSIREFKEAKEQEIEDIKVENDSQFDKLVKIANQYKEINQQLSDVDIRMLNVIINQKAYYKRKLEKRMHRKKIKELINENYALKQVFQEFEEKYPNEVRQYIETIKNEQSS